MKQYKILRCLVNIPKQCGKAPAGGVSKELQKWLCGIMLCLVLALAILGGMGVPFNIFYTGAELVRTSSSAV
jgi:hypothetical protein